MNLDAHALRAKLVAIMTALYPRGVYTATATGRHLPADGSPCEQMDVGAS